MHMFKGHCDGHGFGRRFARGDDEFGDRPRGGGRHMGGGGRHGRRFFDHGDLRLVVLGLIAEKPRHGYEVIKAIEEALGGQYSPSPGVVYPTLTLLEELGHVEIQLCESNRKLYAVTEAGRAFLDTNKGAVDALFARMAETRAIHGDGPPPQIIRAMENLKTALRLKLAAGKPSDEAIRQAAAAIDAAALAIENL
ncbi:PadR family transcriptional regulator [Zavarzinia sp.]|uniref:PadR family transcriptional regulator n=1 Tax=Zavarzinia sp. TaxID=2027920 RepID=UPI003BB52C4C